MSLTEKMSGITSNRYIAERAQSSGLFLRKRGAILDAFTARKEKGLFHLFFHKDFLYKMCDWTNAKLKEKGAPLITRIKFDAYIGIEFAMSLNPTTRLHNFWSKKFFLGNYDIQKIMSRPEFQKNRANLCHYPFYDRVVALNDPLWHSRAMMRHFQKKCASIAAPIGVLSLDEVTI